MAMFERKVMRVRRHKRVRVKVQGTAERPRLAVFRSNKHMYAQLVDDETGNTVAAASTTSKVLAEQVKNLKGLDRAKAVGEALGEVAASRQIKRVVFDRAGFAYRGRIKALADGARTKGLEF